MQGGGMQPNGAMQGGSQVVEIAPGQQQGPNAQTTMQDVINQIHRLHAPSGPFGAREATQWLMQWSAGCTWESLLVLMQSEEPLVLFFSANVMAQKAQAGRTATPQIAQQVLHAITLLNAPVPNGNQGLSSSRIACRRQLCVAYAAMALYGNGSLEEAVQALQNEHYQPMLEMLKIFPEEVRSSRVMVDQEQRLALVNKLLMSQEQVFDALASNTSFPVLKLQACEQWLSLPSPEVIASKETGAKFTAEIIRRKCWEHPLLQLAAQSLCGNDVEEADAASGALVALITLTNEYNDLTAPAISLVAKSCIHLANLLSPAIDVNTWMPYGPTSPNADENIQRLNFVSKILAELGPHFYRALGVGDWCEQLAEVALHWLQLRQVDLARGGLEFWYGCLVSRHVDGSAKELLYPYLQKFTHACLSCTRYPSNPEAHEGFETDHFVRFREHCNQCLTEAVATVLPVSWVIHLVGERIQSLQQWNDLDAAVFILTGVAPRAPAGQDNVIPKLIAQIPNFPYPQNGLPALLLRISAGRLILYTAGYLSYKEEALVPTLNFLLTELLPALPKIECQDKDLKQYSQAICTDALRITTQSAKEKLLELENGTLWKRTIEQIVELVLNPGFHPDVRAQMVFSVGHIIGAMRDYTELEQTLAAFVQKLEPQYDITTYSGRDGKGPPELKLYLAGLSCCYDIVQEPVSGALHHPVLHFWESIWDRIEKLMRICVEREWEDFIEQFCLSLTFIFTSAKTHAINSKLLGNSLILLSKACEHKPTTYYFNIVRTVMSLFAPHGIKEVDENLVQFLGQFALPVAKRTKEGKQEITPEITAACYDMLADALRWSNLMNGALQSSWLSEVFDAALVFIQSPEMIATHDAPLTAVLKFFTDFLRWAAEQPAVVKYAKALWESEGRVAILVEALLALLVRCADNPRVTTVGAIAEVLQPMLKGPMEFTAKECLKDGFQRLPPPLEKNAMEAHKIVTNLTIAKSDCAKFARIVYELCEDFHAEIKRHGQFSQNCSQN